MYAEEFKKSICIAGKLTSAETFGCSSCMVRGIQEARVKELPWVKIPSCVLKYFINLLLAMLSADEGGWKMASFAKLDVLGRISGC